MDSDREELIRMAAGAVAEYQACGHCDGSCGECTGEATAVIDAIFDRLTAERNAAYQAGRRDALNEAADRLEAAARSADPRVLKDTTAGYLAAAGRIRTLAKETDRG